MHTGRMEQSYFNKFISTFFLSQVFAKRFSGDDPGRIINLLDWRALRPGDTYLPYTMTKVALAALTKSLAISFAPRIAVNGLALGAILPPVDQSNLKNNTKNIPMGRWATIEELTEPFLLLITGSSYIKGEINHLYRRRHLV
jgi:NAD(P)-dependent dehydrogenase (short-subunit alcohol dehydrogenase family)